MEVLVSTISSPTESAEKLEESGSVGVVLILEEELWELSVNKLVKKFSVKG
jgi:hypothetical protein